MNKYDYGVVIGRFQIPHHGHFRLFKEALEQSRRVIIAIGSCNLGRSLRNPFSFEQRVSMIEHCDVPEITAALRDKRLIFVPLEDSLYSDTWWVEQVQRKINAAIDNDRRSNTLEWMLPPATIALIGCNKDDSSYYLSMFPQWPFIELTPERTYAATECRNAYYEFGPHNRSVQNKLHDYTTQGVIQALQYIPDFVHKNLQDRFKYVKEYQAEWGTGPFETVDAVVIQSGHVLCIKRGGESFNSNLWALPGGFKNDGESTLAGAKRELKEETTLDLVTSFSDAYYTFDKDDRDDRAKIITHGFLFKLDDGPLPEVEGTDDAVEARWVPLVDLRADNMYGDHYFIIRKLIAGL